MSIRQLMTISGRFFLIVILFAHIGCRDKLKLSELEFPERIFANAIAEHNIDSVYLIYSYHDNGEPRKDTFYSIYDHAGNLLYELGGKKIFGTSWEYTYDSLNMLKSVRFHTDFACFYQCNYLFIEDSLALLQCWSGNYTDTFVYRFNKQGKLLSSLACEHMVSGPIPRWENKYYYNDFGQLVHVISHNTKDMKSFMYEQEYFGTKLPFRQTQDYYYTGPVLDSMVGKKFSREGVMIEEMRTFYKEGLHIKEFVNRFTSDSVRSSLELVYRYVKRGE